MSELVVETPHGRVAVVDYGGTGPGLVLLHGAGRTLGDWGLVLPYLREQRRVVAMDFRWHGLSSDEGDVGLEAEHFRIEIRYVKATSGGGRIKNSCFTIS